MLQETNSREICTLTLVRDMNICKVRALYLSAQLKLLKNRHMCVLVQLQTYDSVMHKIRLWLVAAHTNNNVTILCSKILIIIVMIVKKAILTIKQTIIRSMSIALFHSSQVWIEKEGWVRIIGSNNRVWERGRLGNNMLALLRISH